MNNNKIDKPIELMGKEHSSQGRIIGNGLGVNGNNGLDDTKS